MRTISGEPAPAYPPQTDSQIHESRPELPRLYTLEEAAAALHAKVTVSSLRRAIHAGRLAATKIGSRFYVSTKAMKEFIECPVPVAQPVSINARTMAPGSSSTAANNNARAMVEASMRKLRERSRTTSPNNDPHGTALQRHRK